MSTSSVAVATVLVAVLTYVARVTPFALLRGRRDRPLVVFLARAMPLGVMIVLVAYTLHGVGPALGSWLPPAAGILVTAGAQWRWRRVAVSLVTGTGVYVLLTLLLT